MYIHVKVITNTKKESFEQIDKDHFKISVREPAERNLANARILELVRNRFPDSRGVKIVSGHHSPSKLLSVNTEE